MSQWYSVEIFGISHVFGHTDMTPEQVRAHFEARYPSEAIGAIALMSEVTP